MKRKYLHLKLKKWIGVILIPLMCAACNLSSGTSSSTDSTSDSSSSDTFPTSLAVASPLDYTTDDSSDSSVSYLSTSSASSLPPSYVSSTPVPKYTWATGVIDILLSTTSASSCTAYFNPELFLTQESDADCFGPEVAYEDHPDDTSTGTGTLPPKDVGIWLETDTTSSNACAAEQFNSRMSSVRDKSNASLMGLAALVCVANTSGAGMPDATTPTVTLTSDMNALGVTDTTFNTAEISYDSSTGTYSYELDLTYSPTTGSHDIVVSMEHTHTSTAVFDGKVSYLVNDSFMGGNCPTSDVTYNGSLEYNSASRTEMVIQVNAGLFCDHDADGRDTDGLIDPSNKLTSSNPTGWGNNFYTLRADYDPTTLDGNFAFSWQAGPNDGNARIMNMNINTSATLGFAFYGYGDDIEDTDGSITGFICNWAGPGADHTQIEYAQYQEMSVDTSTGIINSDAANITYAPVVGCEYDGTSTFVFDTDADGDLTDEDPTLDITIASATMDLIEEDDVDADGTSSIEEVIEDYGFDLP